MFRRLISYAVERITETVRETIEERIEKVQEAIQERIERITGREHEQVELTPEQVEKIEDSADDTSDDKDDTIDSIYVDDSPASSVIADDEIIEPDASTDDAVSSDPVSDDRLRTDDDFIDDDYYRGHRDTDSVEPGPSGISDVYYTNDDDISSDNDYITTLPDNAYDDDRIHLDVEFEIHLDDGSVITGDYGLLAIDDAQSLASIILSKNPDIDVDNIDYIYLDWGDDEAYVDGDDLLVYE